jgi:hypothetical protein
MQIVQLSFYSVVSKFVSLLVFDWTYELEGLNLQHINISTYQHINISTY